MFNDESSNGTAEHTDGLNGAALSGGIDQPMRSIVIRRRAKLLSILDGVGTVGITAVDLVKDTAWDCPEASLPLVQADLAVLMEAKLAEKVGAQMPNAPDLFILTLLGEKSVADHAWTEVAASVTPEDPAARPAPAEVNGTNGAPATTWGDVAAASEAKNSRKSKKSDEPSPQLGFGSGPGRFTMDLPCPVSDEALRDLQMAHLSICDERDQVEEDKKAAAQSFAARLKEIDEREASARSELRLAMDGTVRRPVECERRLDGSTMRIYRCDTGEQVEERAATAAELEAANPPPATTEPDGAEVRDSEATSHESSNGDEKSSNAPAKTKRGRKPKGEQAAVH